MYNIKTYYILCLVALLFTACTNPIKNEATITVEEGTTITTTDPSSPISTEMVKTSPTTNEVILLVGTWVGDFEKAAGNEDKNIEKQGIYWDRTNKITIEIQRVEDGKVQGRSIVAGNDRPFEGTIISSEGEAVQIEAREPGDDRYDGTFSFTIKDDILKGTWTAYKDIDIKERKYSLEQRKFVYNPDQMLEYAKQYIDWNNSIKTVEVYESGDEVEEWITEEFASATDFVYELNASNTRLTEEQVANLKRGDLTLIRNAIYARHGYSFKHRPLRVFFDAQEWYIPVHTDIRSNFTELEKENIALLLRYEKNAAEYYDRFGR